MSFCSIFPIEIINSIGFLLSTQDLASSLLVCRAWNYNFSPIIYKSISLDNPHQFHLLHSALTKSLSSNQPSGHHVRTLDILDARAIQTGVGQLPALCPNITSLKVTQKWASRVYSIVCVNDGALVRTIKSLLDSLVVDNLTSLCLDFYTRIDSNILPPLANLQHLTLGWVDQGISPATLQRVHSRCPHLISLTLSGLDLIDQLNLGATSTLQSLSLYFRKGMDCDESWLSYISHTYTHLSHLRLEAPAQYSETVDSAPLLIPLAYHRFASHANSLRQLELIHTVRHHVLIHLLHSYRVPLASLALQTKFGFPRDFCDTLFNIFPSLASLSVQGHLRYKDSSEPVRSLVNFSNHLRHLNIGQWDTLQLDILLRALPRLTHLTVQDSTLLTSLDWTKSCLESLILDKVSLSCEVVDIRGTSLKHLVLRRCTTVHKSLKIRIPDQTLLRLEIDEICVGQPVWKSDRIVQSIEITKTLGSSQCLLPSKQPGSLEIECGSVLKLIMNQKDINV
ncbi:hypothetical protein CLU79DRAFT_745249 [Phycomyces nitens]|nr:hypothetical protein CLU79DRAFT_745249 [Phycomyces nitens]